MLSTKKWAELKDGYGLEEIPKSLRHELTCHLCGRNWPGKLYTTQPLPHSSNLRQYQKEIDNLRNHCYCRYHAEQMFSD